MSTYSLLFILCFKLPVYQSSAECGGWFRLRRKSRKILYITVFTKYVSFKFRFGEGGLQPDSPSPRVRACYQTNCLIYETHCTSYLSACLLKLATRARCWCLYTLWSTHICTDFDRVVFSRFNVKIRVFGKPAIPKKQEHLRKNFAVMFMIFLHTHFT